MDNKLKLFKEFPVSGMTGFKIGGKVRYYIEIEHKKDLLEVNKLSKKTKLPVFVLGMGTNILVSDKKQNAIFIKLKNKNINFASKGKYTTVTAGAGVIWDELVHICVKSNLYGIESLSGIPGTVGAAPVQNIGAYGQELKDTFFELVAFDQQKEAFITLNNKDCEFGYRDSIFKKDGNKSRYIIWEVRLKLTNNTKPKVKYESLKKYLADHNIISPNPGQVRRAVIKLRSLKLENPDVNGNAGSYFKNPFVSLTTYKEIADRNPLVPSLDAGNGKIKLFAGWLIENTGWKGKVYKNAGVSPKNALVLINRDRKSSAREILELGKLIKRDVKVKFKVELEEEVQFVSF